MGHKTASEIINRVAIEIGVPAVASPFSSGDTSMALLVALLNTCGDELIETHQWGFLRREHSFTTAVPPDDNEYDLPSDYRYMIDQTGWQRTNRVPLFGPISAQQWQYLEGRDLSSSTIYASFRLMEGKLFLYPTTPPDGIEIAYEYISENWVENGDAAGTFDNKVEIDSDIVLYNSRLIERLLKSRFLEARGFDTTAADQAYQTSLDQVTGQELSAPILNAGDGGWQYPYLDGLRNTPDSGYGS